MAEKFGVTMVMGERIEGTQILIVGAGPGGYVAAIRAAQLGKDVTLVDKDPNGFGGICLNEGCIPSKTLIHAADFYHKIKTKAPEFGISAKDVSVDAVKLAAWTKNVKDKLRSGIQFLLKANKVNVLIGNAEFLSSSQIRVTNGEQRTVIEFERAILATGGKAISLPTVPVDGEIIWDAKSALELKKIPKELIVVGGGYIGLELGEMYAKLGSKVRIIEALDRLLSGMDADVLPELNRRLDELGVEVLLGTKIESANMKGKKAKVVANSKEKGKLELEADAVLVAIGSRPNTSGLGLEKTRVQLDERGSIKVDAQRRTTDAKIFAIGDVAGQPMLAHKASSEAKVAAEAACGMNSAYEPQAVAAVVFTDPEIAVVGLSEEEAKKQGYAAKSVKFPFSALGRAISMGETRGFVKLIFDESSKTILGWLIVGPHAGDLISEGALSVEMGAQLEDVALTIHPHPTLPEALMEAAELALGRPIHTLKK